MDLGALLVPLIMLFVIISLIMAIMSLAGVHPSMILLLLSTSRRYRTEQTPRDHFERWIYAKRRSGRPKSLKYVKITGDRWVPTQTIGKVKSLEPWMSGYIIFIKYNRLGWSTAHFVDKTLCSDVNRRVLWIRANGFSASGPVRFPIPTEDFKDIDAWVNRHQELFRHSFEQQISMDILEDSAWGIGHAMAPPIGERIKITEADRPDLVDKEVIPENSSTGGMM